MKATSRELTAAGQLAEAIIEFLVAVEEGRAQRRSQRPRDELAVRIEHAPLPAPPPELTPAPPPNSELPDDTLLSARAAAKYLSVGDRKLWEITAPRGPLAVVRFGKATRYRVEDLRDLVQRNRIKPRKDAHI